MTKPTGFRDDVWQMITAASIGDTATLQRLLNQNPELGQATGDYEQPIHFAARAGHLEAVRLLLAAGADPEWNGYHDVSLIEMARERGYEEIARTLEHARDRRGRAAPLDDHPIHEAAQSNDVARLRTFLDDDPFLVNRRDRMGGAPLHRAVRGAARNAIAFLLDRGAKINAIHSVARGANCGCSPIDLAPIDLALNRRDTDTIRLLLNRGATCDLTIAAALGDRERILALLDEDPTSIARPRASGRRPLHTAIECGHRAIALLLLDRGANPRLDSSLHTASSLGDLELVRSLLAHGADPNAHAFCGGNALFAAKTAEIRALLKRHEATLDPYDLAWMDRDDEVMREIEKDPASAERGCGGVYTAVCTRGNKKLLMRLLDAGVPVPSVGGGCRSYLLENLEMLRILLEHGMSPDLPDWQGQTFLHALSRKGKPEEMKESIERATILLDAGAALSPREEEYNSTPLAWAARTNNRDMLEFLLARGAPVTLPDDASWSTPLAWAKRRGHTEIADILRRHGA
ncbi:MAG TPA: ankyrin repeat domain-containing protein [Bryobacteraceae bacterium]|nr:ankyrin repeat domain-containing protein [Bryobacteraceae bacterium]